VGRVAPATVAAGVGRVICIDGSVSKVSCGIEFAAWRGLAATGQCAVSPLKYLVTYPADLQAQVRGIMDGKGLAAFLRGKYPVAHGIRSDRALFQYVSGLKGEYLRNAEPVDKVLFDSKIHVIQQALGLHTTRSRVQGNRLKASHEIRIASVFKDSPPEFLRMIAVHELAHLKEREHDKAFYKLCSHMEPGYHQLEFDVRLYLTHLELTGERLWAGEGSSQTTE
jgi:predicted metal-dependent hydrolase